MKKLKVEFRLSIGYAGAKHKETCVFDFKDDLAPDEIEKELAEYWEEWKNDFLDGGWKIVKEEDGK